VVLGLTGPNAAGKGEVAAHLERRGFRLHSLSDIVREEAARRGLPPEREHLIRTGNELRAELGAGALARRILDRLGRRDVVDSIRNPAEVAVLRERDDFFLLGVSARPELRFQRSIARGRAGDPESFEEFLYRERQENSSDPGAQQLGATFQLADHVVQNDGDLDNLHRAVDELLARLKAAAQ
jgi:dephospho-CoA kinase